jgi:hypothetical protein
MSCQRLSPSTSPSVRPAGARTSTGKHEKGSLSAALYLIPMQGTTLPLAIFETPAVGPNHWQRSSFFPSSKRTSILREPARDVTTPNPKRE